MPILSTRIFVTVTLAVRSVVQQPNDSWAWQYQALPELEDMKSVRQRFQHMIGFAGMIATISRSRKILNKTGGTPPSLHTEDNRNQSSAFEAWLKSYQEHLEEVCLSATTADPGGPSCSCQNAGHPRKAI
jgi:hypothetical protein